MAAESLTLIASLIIAALGTAGAVTGLLIKTKELKAMKIKNYEHTMKNNLLKGILQIQTFNGLVAGVQSIFSKTKTDRFLVLIGLEEHGFIRFVKVIFSRNKEEGGIKHTEMYASVLVDDNYRKMLKEVQLNDLVILKIDEMDNSVLKGLYEDENIKHSVIRWIKEFKLKGNSSVIAFSSLATHSELHFTKKELGSMRIIFDSKIKPAIISIIKGDKGDEMFEEIKSNL